MTGVTGLASQTLSTFGKDKDHFLPLHWPRSVPWLERSGIPLPCLITPQRWPLPHKHYPQLLCCPGSLDQSHRNEPHTDHSNTALVSSMMNFFDIPNSPSSALLLYLNKKPSNPEDWKYLPKRSSLLQTPFSYSKTSISTSDRWDLKRESNRLEVKETGHNINK